VAVKKSSGKVSLKKNCKKGWPCKGACISQKKKCSSTIKGGPPVTYQQWLGEQADETGVSSGKAKSGLSPKVQEVAKKAAANIAKLQKMLPAKESFSGSSEKAEIDLSLSQAKKLSLSSLQEIYTASGLGPINPALSKQMAAANLIKYQKSGTAVVVPLGLPGLTLTKAQQAKVDSKLLLNLPPGMELPKVKPSDAGSEVDKANKAKLHPDFHRMYDLSSGLGIQTPHTGGEILVLQPFPLSFSTVTAFSKPVIQELSMNQTGGNVDDLG
jgi:hypothetical protein